MKENNIYLENIMNRLNELGMENENNYESNLQYKINQIINSPEISENPLYKSNLRSIDDEAMLDNLLSGQDEIARNETLEELIKQREELKNKKLGEIKHQRDEIRSLRIKSGHPYHFNPKLYDDLTKMYSDLDHLAVDEEIKAWKDVMFLQLKKMDGNGGFYVSQDETYK